MTTDSDFRVRFAPSPTGYLHVGGARTALFNWLLARQRGGTFILRIEDTDRMRHVAGAENKILEDLRWLGLQWDEGPEAGGDCGPYFQGQRLDIYHEHIRRLLNEGRAYYALETPEELDAAREQARREKASYTYRRPDPLPTIEQGEAAIREGRPVVVRFKTPPGGVVVSDHIRGEVCVGEGEIEDFVIQKGDGWPTYHLACVVDDALMKISLVCRGQDHLSNTPKHVLLQRAFGFPTPEYAHLPLIFNMSGSKMGKRDKHTAVQEAVTQLVRSGQWKPQDIAVQAGCEAEAAAAWFGDKKAKQKPEFQAMEMPALLRLAAAANVHLPEIDVHDFRASGYLPQALSNFLNLLGWSAGDDKEFFTRDEAVAAFSVERIIKSHAKFDREKLLSLNTDWAAQLDVDELLTAFKDWALVSGSVFNGLGDDMLRRVLAACKGFRTFGDVETKAGALFAPDNGIVFDPKAVKKVLAKNEGAGYAMLHRILPELAVLTDWTADAIDKLIADFCEREGCKLGDVAQPIRVAVSGKTISPAIGETLAILGKDKTSARINACVAARGSSED